VERARGEVGGVPEGSVQFVAVRIAAVVNTGQAAQQQAGGAGGGGGGGGARALR
jgi:hypothetical protein